MAWMFTAFFMAPEFAVCLWPRSLLFILWSLCRIWAYYVFIAWDLTVYLLPSELTVYLWYLSLLFVWDWDLTSSYTASEFTIYTGERFISGNNLKETESQSNMITCQIQVMRPHSQEKNAFNLFSISFVHDKISDVGLSWNRTQNKWTEYWIYRH